MPTAKEIQDCILARNFQHEKPKRKTARQQVREERERVLREIRVAMVDKKRTIPQQWERGFMCAMSVIERFEK